MDLFMNHQPHNLKYHRKFRGLLIDLNNDLFLIDDYIMNLEPFDLRYDELHFYIMALEDRRFLRHGGFDCKAFLRAILKRFGGASTIDMQLVRTLTGFKKKTFFRKFYESILAFIINFRYSKRQIIECYIQNAFFGSGMIGIKRVLKSYNVETIYELTDFDKRIVASLLQTPKPLKPSQFWYEKLRRRSSYAEKVRFRVKNSKN